MNCDEMSVSMCRAVSFGDKVCMPTVVMFLHRIAVTKGHRGILNLMDSSNVCLCHQEKRDYNLKTFSLAPSWLLRMLSQNFLASDEAFNFSLEIQSSRTEC